MTKTEEFNAKLKEIFTIDEQRRLLMIKHYGKALEVHKQAQQALEKSPLEEVPRKKFYTSLFTTRFFGAEICRLEALAFCRGYKAYTEIFKGEVRQGSSRLRPITEAAKVYNFVSDYGSIGGPSYCALPSHNARDWYVCASFIVGTDYTSYSNRLLDSNVLAEEITKLEGIPQGLETPTDIYNRAETAAAAWLMLEAERDKYKKDLILLSTLLTPICCYAAVNDHFKVSRY